MLPADAERLYALLPAIYRLRDAQAGGPLRALVAVLAREIAAVQEGIEQAYDDLFIETCAEWAVPYIGELIGARLLRLPAGSTLSQRAEVANTLALRRRKGTIAVIEEIASESTNWPAVAVEFFGRLATTQHVRHVRDEVGTVDFRDRAGLERIDSAFDRAAHTFEARRIVTGRGRYSIPNVGIFLFRLRALPLRDVTASRVDDFRYRVDPLGIDQPLFTLPDQERSLSDLAQPTHVPVPISRLAMQADRDAYYPRSVAIEIDGRSIPASEVIVCNLANDGGGGWTHAPADRLAIDPVLGRLGLPTSAPAPGADAVRVTYHYGAPDAIGGGAYDRTPPPMDGSQGIVSGGSGLQAALAAVGTTPVIELTDSRTYDLASGSPNLAIPAVAGVVIAAADGQRPLVRVSGGELVVDAAAGATLTLSGIVFSGGTVRIRGALKRLTIEHCTFVPGVARSMDNEPAQAGGVSIVVEAPTEEIAIHASVLGALRVSAARVSITRSVVDATEPGQIAYAAPDDTFGGDLTLETCTVVGQVRTRRLDASSSILLAEAHPGTPPVHAAQVQSGCVRYSFLPLASRTVSPYRCLPTTADPEVRPLFTTLRFGVPGYAQLAAVCPPEIVTGGEDEGEMGVFHDLYRGHREANLRLRLEEYLRFGLEAGILFTT